MSATYPGSRNPNWKGGPVRKTCDHCGNAFLARPGRALTARFCSRGCSSRWLGNKVRKPRPIRTIFHRGNGVFGVEPKRQNKKHGLSKTNAHRSWIAMLQRCYNPKCERFDVYGGRGITVCERWRESFANFYADMGERPPSMSLDRIDSNLGYSKENCRWASTKDQSRNKTNSLFVTIGGERRTLAEWAEISGINYHTLHKRIRLGFSADRLLEDGNGHR